MRRRSLLLSVLVTLVFAGQAQAWTWPAPGPVLRPFVFGDDPYLGGQHRGIDVGGDTGAPAAAPAAGTVAFAGSVPGGGKTVSIRTTDGAYSVTLVHLGSIAVSRGQEVAEGATVGRIGPSGDAEVGEPYVHLGIRVADEPEGYVDPLKLLPARAPAAASPPEPAPVPTAPPPAEPAPPEPANAPVAAAPPTSETTPPSTTPSAAEPQPTPTAAAEPAPAPAPAAIPARGPLRVRDTRPTREPARPATRLPVPVRESPPRPEAAPLAAPRATTEVAPGASAVAGQAWDTRLLPFLPRSGTDRRAVLYSYQPAGFRHSREYIRIQPSGRIEVGRRVRPRQ